MRKFLQTILILLTTVCVYAQDPEFSQYYSAPLYLNPAFSGTSVDHRFIANYRNQWPSINKAFQTYGFSYDYNLERLNSGVGVMLLSDKAGTSHLKSTQVNLQYAYKVKVSDTWMLSSGLNFGVGFRNIDYNNLVFYDQLEFSQDGVNLPPSSIGGIDPSSYFDFGAGILAYSRKFWFGFAASHLNKPNRSFMEDASTIPVKTTLHGGVRIPLYQGVFKRDRIASIAPSFVYKQQGKFDQLDIGTHLFYDPIVLGIWYRGIPIQQDVADNLSHDAVVVILGFDLKNVELTYSYDITVSKLAQVSGGAHEIALKFSLDMGARVTVRKKEKFIPCPTFYKY
jgi:type IX secretion system PorP/SprF family membrane protein